MNWEAAELEEYDDHELVREIRDEITGLEGLVAIHSSKLGPAVGGTRMYPYANKREAVRDALRLSRAMTYKCALAKVPYGGGKAVIIGDPVKDKSKELIKVYASQIGKLGGMFYTGEDVGISEEDVQVMLEVAPFFIGRSGVAGDPSPYAALSTFVAMKAAVKKLFGRDGVQGLTVGVKGVGKVGGRLVQLLVESGARVLIADIRKEATEDLRAKYRGVIIVDPLTIQAREMDVYAPCALGGEFREETIGELKCRLVCGAANNQLVNREAGEALYAAGIWYVPDYVANAGGLINVVDELEKNGYSRKRVMKRIKRVGLTVERIISKAQKDKKPPSWVADEMVRAVIMK